MSKDQPRSTQRYSRFSRTEVPPPGSPAEPTMEQIAARALNLLHKTADPETYDRQPPPPPMMADVDGPSAREALFEALEQRGLLSGSDAAGAEQAPLTRPVRKPRAQPHDVDEASPAAAISEELVSAPQSQTPVPEPSAPTQEAKQKDRPSATEPPARKTAAVKKKQGPGAAQRAVTLARTRALPVLANGAQWVAKNLRPRELHKRYGEALVFTHNRVLDRRLEKLFFIPTLSSATLNPALDRGILYDGPVPSKVFGWVMSVLPKDLREFAFIDFRAGRGRTMLFASRYNFDRIVGFEFDGQLFDDLQMNIAQYPRSLMTCRNIDCYRGDLDGITIPDQPSVLYFSSAWQEQMLPSVMQYVRETYRQSPRRLYLVLENADERLSLRKDEIFRRITPPMSERLKLKLLSPMDVQIYCSAV